MRAIYLVITLGFLFSCSSSSDTNNKTIELQVPDSTTLEANEGIDSNQIIISGNVESDVRGAVFLEVNEQNQLVKIASAEIDSLGGFEIKVDDLQKNYVYNVSFSDGSRVFLYLDTNRIAITKKDGVFKISGSKESEYYNQYMTIVLKYNKDLTELNKSFQYYANSGNQKEAEKVSQEFQVTNGKRLDELKSYLSNIPASMTLMNGMIEYTEDIDNHLSFLKSALAKIKQPEVVLENKDEFIKHIESKMLLAVGNVAPDFTLPTPEGGTISLSSLRGKYVMIDFWASWCGPCRAENPNVVKVYNKYKNDGFEILGVALDKDRERWLGAIEKDGLIWKHGSDLKHWQSDVAAQYGITGIPFTLLVDPKGKIVAKNLRGDALEQKMKSIFTH